MKKNPSFTVALNSGRKEIQEYHGLQCVSTRFNTIYHWVSVIKDKEPIQDQSDKQDTLVDSYKLFTALMHANQTQNPIPIYRPIS